MIVIGLTGSIGMGKSTAAAMLKGLGCRVDDADAQVHRLMRPGGAAVAAIEAAFPGVCGPDGGIDRGALGARVIGDAAALDRLEAILHPKVAEERRRFLGRCARDRVEVAALDVPLLFETGLERHCDLTLLVTAPRFLQEQRVLRRPGMTREKLAGIRARQLPEAEKRKRADIVIPTGNGRRPVLRALIRALKLARERGGRHWPPRPHAARYARPLRVPAGES